MREVLGHEIRSHWGKGRAHGRSGGDGRAIVLIGVHSHV